MIFLDANIFLRFLAGGSDPASVERAKIARTLFERIRSGELQATTSEVVIHEVCFILESPRQFGRSAPQIIEVISELLLLKGMWFPDGDQMIYLNAMRLWRQQPRIGFADAVTAARCQRRGYELATFDRHFERVSSVTLWRPDEDAASGQ